MEAHGAVQSLALAFGAGALVTLASDRLRQPPILFLLLVGFGLGVDGLGLVDGDALGTSGLLAIVSVSVGLLVFEGGLGLDRDTIARAPGAVRGLLTVGVIVSWMLTALLGHYLIGLPLDLSILLGAMLVVTGPTVIQPILRRTPLSPRLHSALMTEGILIDPIGVVAAVSTLEIVRLGIEQPGEAGPMAILVQFLVPAVTGVGLGVIFGYGASRVLRIIRGDRKADTQTVVLVGLAACMVSFGLAEAVSSEAGLVAATLCGLVLANAARPSAEEMRRFKETTAVMLVGALFILLASRVQLDRLWNVGWEEIAFVAAMVLLVRPASVFASTFRTGLNFRERMYTALIAPRGIVAIALGAIVAIEMTRTAAAVEGRPDLVTNAEKLETLVILVIVVTVTLAGLTAGPLATLLKVRAGRPNGVIIVGGHRLGRDLAAHLRALSVPVRLVDTNAANIAAAASEGIGTSMGSATDIRWMDQEVASTGYGNVLALSDNNEVDGAVSLWAAQRFGVPHVLRWRRDKPVPSPKGQPQPGTAMKWGRPIRHMLFQMDAGLARVATWEDAGVGAVAIVGVDEQGQVHMIDDGDVEKAFPDGPPEGMHFIGVEIGPAKNKAAAGEGEEANGDEESEESVEKSD
ncbi:MAG: sodium:proton antiporter [Phycisphaera sp.]|nr:MAG: sodium:proton antiporter [Phycisphaera sp.]